jgi:ABC-2 family transporter protein
VIAFTASSSLSDAQFRERTHAAEVQRRAENEHVRQCLHAHGVQPGDDFSDQVAHECLPDKPDASAHDPRFHRARLEGILKGSSGVLAIVGWALGASLVGAEFASRSMTTLLTWETRRWRVIAAKATVVLVSVFVIGVVALTLLALAMLPALLAHGAPFAAGDPTFAHYAGVVVRGGVLAALGAGMGLAIATLGRNTAAALGVGFAYIIVLENILGGSLRNWRRWLLLGNAIVFVSGHNGGDIPGRSVLGAGIFLGAVALTLLVAATSLFRARDIA